MVKAGAPGADGVAEWFGTAEGASALKAGGHGAVGIDATCTAAAFADKLERALGQDAKVVDLHGSGNPVYAVWGASRPPAPAAPLRVHPAEHAGEAAPSKLERVREAYPRPRRNLSAECPRRSRGGAATSAECPRRSRGGAATSAEDLH